MSAHAIQSKVSPEPVLKQVLGFTLIELILVVALVLYLGLISVIFYSNFYLKSAASGVAQDFALSLRKAQTYSMAGRQGGSWGVAYTGGNIVLFQGASYAARNSAFDEITSVPPALTVTGFNETVFSRITGFPNATSTITISGSGLSKLVTVETQGIINVLTGTIAVISAPTSSVPWYDVSWSYRQPITIDHNKVASSTGAESYISFPVLVNVTSSALKATSFGGHIGNADGSDILFTASDGTTKLNHEIESYTSSTGNLVAWVNVGAAGLSTSTDSAFYMYYGNAGAANQQNAAATWDASYKGVWHFRNAAALTANDSTSNVNNGSIIGAVAATGKVGVAASLGSGQSITIASAPPIDNLQPFSWEFWARANNTQSYTSLVNKTWKSCVFINFTLGCGVYSLGSSESTSATTTANTWYHVVTTYTSGNTLTQYMNGTVVSANTANGPRAENGNNIVISGNAAITFDEFRISNVVRSADWIQTEYNNENTPSAFETMGTEQVSNSTPPPPSSSSTTVIAPSALAAVPLASSSVQLSWADNSDNETGFEIDRATSSNPYASIATVGANVTSYNNVEMSADNGITWSPVVTTSIATYSWRIQGLTSGNTYSFRIYEFSSVTGAVSAYSNILTQVKP